MDASLLRAPSRFGPAIRFMGHLMYHLAAENTWSFTDVPSMGVLVLLRFGMAALPAIQAAQQRGTLPTHMTLAHIKRVSVVRDVEHAEDIIMCMAWLSITGGIPVRPYRVEMGVQAAIDQWVDKWEGAHEDVVGSYGQLELLKMQRSVAVGKKLGRDALAQGTKAFPYLHWFRDAAWSLCDSAHRAQILARACVKVDLYPHQQEALVCIVLANLLQMLKHKLVPEVAAYKAQYEDVMAGILTPGRWSNITQEASPTGVRQPTSASVLLATAKSGGTKETGQAAFWGSLLHWIERAIDSMGHARGFMLLDDMGLGKTLESITSALVMRVVLLRVDAAFLYAIPEVLDAACGPIVIVTDTPGVFQREIKKHTVIPPEKVCVFTSYTASVIRAKLPHAVLSLDASKSDVRRAFSGRWLAMAKKTTNMCREYRRWCRDSELFTAEQKRSAAHLATQMKAASDRMHKKASADVASDRANLCALHDHLEAVADADWGGRERAAALLAEFYALETAFIQEEPMSSFKYGILITSRTMMSNELEPSTDPCPISCRVLHEGDVFPTSSSWGDLQPIAGTTSTSKTQRGILYMFQRTFGRYVRGGCSMVIYDEIHSARNPGRVNHEAARYLASMGRLLGMTGTPICNSRKDFAVLLLLISAMRPATIVHESTVGQQLGATDKDIVDAFSTVCTIRRDIEELHLPPITIRSIEVEMTPEELLVYSSVVADTCVATANKFGKRGRPCRTASMCGANDKRVRLSLNPTMRRVIRDSMKAGGYNVNSHKKKKKASNATRASADPAEASWRDTLAGVGNINAKGGHVFSIIMALRSCTIFPGRLLHTFRILHWVRCLRLMQSRATPAGGSLGTDDPDTNDIQKGIEIITQVGGRKLSTATECIMQAFGHMMPPCLLETPLKVSHVKSWAGRMRKMTKTARRVLPSQLGGVSIAPHVAEACLSQEAHDSVEWSHGISPDRRNDIDAVASLVTTPTLVRTPDGSLKRVIIPPNRVNRKAVPDRPALTAKEREMTRSHGMRSPAYISSKLARVVTILTVYHPDAAFVIFVQDYATQDSVARLFGDQVVVLNGSMNDTERDQALTKFNTNESVRGIVCTTGVGSQAYTFTKATVEIVMQGNWAPHVSSQQHARIRRVGQTKPTFVYRLVSVIPKAFTDAVESFRAARSRGSTSTRKPVSNKTVDAFVARIESDKVKDALALFGVDFGYFRAHLASGGKTQRQRHLLVTRVVEHNDYLTSPDAFRAFESIGISPVTAGVVMSSTASFVLARTGEVDATSTQKTKKKKKKNKTTKTDEL